MTCKSCIGGLNPSHNIITFNAKLQKFFSNVSFRAILLNPNFPLLDIKMHDTAVHTMFTTPGSTWTELSAYSAAQYQHSEVATLKAIPDPGYTVTQWEMNGGILTQTMTELLFLFILPAGGSASRAGKKLRGLSLAQQRPVWDWEDIY